MKKSEFEQLIENVIRKVLKEQKNFSDYKNDLLKTAVHRYKMGKKEWQEFQGELNDAKTKKDLDGIAKKHNIKDYIYEY